MAPSASHFAPLVFAGRVDEGIKALAATGFSGVELSLRHVHELDFEWLAGELEKYGLRVSAFATGRMYLEGKLCLCDLRPSVRAKIQEELIAVMKLASRFQAPVIIGGVRGRLTGDFSHREKQREAAIHALRRLAMIAKDLGIYLVLEPINRYETNFINCTAEGIELIQNVGHPALKLLLDTFHMNIEEADPLSAIRKASKQLGYIHFADNNRLAPGQGHIDFPAVVKVLTEIGYSGFITAEVLPKPDDATALLQTGRYLHTLTRSATYGKMENPS